MNFLQWLYDAQVTIAGHPITWREILGNGFGFASAVGGLRRRVWAWPVGIVGNVLLFSVFIAATFQAGAQQPLFGQAGRQVFFIVTSVYGWWRWAQVRRVNHANDAGGVAITPRWATSRERVAVVVFWLLGTVLVHQAFVWLWNLSPNPFFTPAWWFYWCDAWIFVGSIVATYAMARGWNEFWLAWIGVDLVGVPFAFATDYVPTAVLYTFYGLFVLYGFTQWVKASRVDEPDVEPELARTSG